MSGSQAGSEPVAYITIGGAGSGKSTISKQLSKLTGAAYLDKDTIAGPLVGVALEALGEDPSDRESSRLYREKVMPAEYEALFDAAGRNLEVGVSVVIDAPFVAYLADPGFLRRSVERASWPAARIRVIHVKAQADTVRARLELRGNERDRAKLADWEEYLRAFGTTECLWDFGEHEEFHNDDEAALERLAQLVG